MMKTYLVNQLVGESFKVENVDSTWTCERGVHFCGENDKALGFIPYSNLANYQLVEVTSITITAPSIKFDSTVMAAENSKGVLAMWGDSSKCKCCK